MRVALNTSSHVEVDDERDVCDVDTTACKICSDEDIDTVFAQLSERGFSLLLCLGTVQRDGRKAHVFDVARNGIAIALDIDKDDDGRRELAGIENLLQTLLALLLALDVLDSLLDGFDGLADVANGDNGRATQILSRYALDGGGHGGCVHHGLAIHATLHGVGILGGVAVGLFVGDGQRVENLVDGLLEAHVDHTVCLVHDDIGALAEDQHASLNAVDQTTWGSDDDLGAVAHLEGLFFDGVSTDDDGGVEAKGGGKLACLDLNLLRQLARRGQDNGVWAVGAVRRAEGRQLRDVDQQRQDEGGGFARARDGDADEIAALEGDGDGGTLDGRRVGVAHMLDEAQDLVRQARLLPVAHGVGDGAALGGNVEVLLEDAPVALAHVLQPLLAPVLVELRAAALFFAPPLHVQDALGALPPGHGVALHHGRDELLRALLRHVLGEAAQPAAPEEARLCLLLVDGVVVVAGVFLFVPLKVELLLRRALPLLLGREGRLVLLSAHVPLPYHGCLGVFGRWSLARPLVWQRWRRRRRHVTIAALLSGQRA